MSSVTMKRQRFKTPIMLKCGTHWQVNAILLVGLTFIPKILTVENYNFQQQRYDFIDVAKEAPNGRTKGHTTRIFTTDDGLDEKFWLKYLGEDIRHAVHLQVDNRNNVIPVPDTKQHYQKYDNSEESHSRFVRQPSQHDYKQEPVETLYTQNNNEYPTEKPEIFYVKPTTSALPKPHHIKHKPSHFNTSNKKPVIYRDNYPPHSTHNQNIVQLKPPRTLKAIHKPILVNLPQMDSAEHEINEEHVPLVVQIPPIIYHQKAEVYKENLHE